MTTQEYNIYTTLDEIRLRKNAILKDIKADDEKIRRQWHSLFNKPDMVNKKATPARRINSLFSTGAGMIDAAILGWKLYRKFKK